MVLILIYVWYKSVMSIVVWTQIVFTVPSLESLWQIGKLKEYLICYRLIEFRLFLNSINTSCCPVFVLISKLYCFTIRISSITKYRRERISPIQTIIRWLVMLHNTLCQQLSITILIEYSVRETFNGDNIVCTIAVISQYTILTDVTFLIDCHLTIYKEHV